VVWVYVFVCVCVWGGGGIAQAYKIPRTAAQAVPPELLQRTLRGAAIGGLTLQFPATTAMYVGMLPFGVRMDAEALPSPSAAFWQVGAPTSGTGARC
jgi:hypothetical protein